MRGALGLLCYDWREAPTDDGLFAAPGLPEWAAGLPGELRDLAHPLQSARARAATGAPWRGGNRQAVETILAKGDRPTCEALAKAIARWGRDAAVLKGLLAARVQALVQTRRGDSAGALARALRAVDAQSARDLAAHLAQELAAAQAAKARAACEAIGRLGPGLEDSTLFGLAACLERKDVVAHYAARALARASNGGSDDLSALLAGIQSQDSVLSLVCAQSLRALLIRRREDATLPERLAGLLPAPSAQAPRMAHLGLARIAERIGPEGATT